MNLLTNLRHKIGSNINNHRGLYSAFFILVIISFGILFTFNFTVDDAYISARYAKHLAHGQGLCWNAGENRVEGYTNFLWVILLAIPELLGLPTIYFAKIIGTIALIFTLMLLFNITNNYGGGKFGAYVVIFATILNSATYLHTVSGLETMLYSFLLLQIFVLGLKILEAKPYINGSTCSWLPILTLLVGLVRPEGLLGGSLSILFCFFFKKEYRKCLLVSTSVSVIIGMIYFLWRFNYFDSFMPNPFYFKVGLNKSAGLNRILHELMMFTPGLTILLYEFRIRNREKSIFLYTILFIFAASIIYCFTSAEMDYADRFIYPIFFPMLVMIGISGGRIYYRKSSVSRGCFLTIIMLLPFVFRPVSMLNYGPKLKAAHCELGIQLGKSTVPDSLRSMGLSDAGAVPYYSDWKTIDYSGLNDTRITKEGMQPASILIKENPTIIIFPTTAGVADVSSTLFFPVNTDEILKKYLYLGSVRFDENYYLSIYITNKTSQAIKNELNIIVQNVSKSSRLRKVIFNSNFEKLLYLLKERFNI